MSNIHLKYNSASALTNNQLFKYDTATSAVTSSIIYDNGLGLHVSSPSNADFGLSLRNETFYSTDYSKGFNFFQENNGDSLIYNNASAALTIEHTKNNIGIGIGADNGVKLLVKGGTLGSQYPLWIYNGDGTSDPSNRGIIITPNNDLGLGILSPASKIHVVGIGNDVSTYTAKFHNSDSLNLLSLNNDLYYGGNSSQAFWTIDRTGVYSNEQPLTLRQDEGTSLNSASSTQGHLAIISNVSGVARGSSLRIYSEHASGNSHMFIGNTNHGADILSGAYFDADLTIAQTYGKDITFINSSNQQLLRLRNTGRVAITPGETLDPNAMLHIKSISSGSSLYNAIFQNSLNDYLLTIRDDGNIGVGTNAPTSKLHIQSSTHDTTAYALKVEDDIAGNLLSIRNDGTLINQGQSYTGMRIQYFSTLPTIEYFPYGSATTGIINQSWTSYSAILSGLLNINDSGGGNIAYLGSNSLGGEFALKDHDTYSTQVYLTAQPGVKSFFVGDVIFGGNGTGIPTNGYIKNSSSNYSGVEFGELNTYCLIGSGYTASTRLSASKTSGGNLTLFDGTGGTAVYLGGELTGNAQTNKNWFSYGVQVGGSEPSYTDDTQVSFKLPLLINSNASQALKVFDTTNTSGFQFSTNGFVGTDWIGSNGQAFFQVFDQLSGFWNPNGPTLGFHFGSNGSPFSSRATSQKLTTMANVSTDAFVALGGDSTFNVIGAASNGYSSFGVDSPSARVHIQGSTNDASAYALKLHDNTTANLLSIRNDGVISGTYINIDNIGSVFFGYGAGSGGVTGYHNTAVGYTAGNSLTTGADNFFWGVGSGKYVTIGYGNNYLGGSAGLNNTSGAYNIAIGESSQGGNPHSSIGNFNVSLGNLSLLYIGSGSHNFAVGYRAGHNIVDASNNIMIGRDAGFNVNSDENVIIGLQAGFTTTGSSNVMIGASAGFYETGSRKLFIDSLDRGSEATGRVNSLIYGVFDASPENQRLTVNAPIRSHNFTATEASSISALDGDMIYVTDTNGTFTQIGFWGYENGTWVKL